MESDPFNTLVLRAGLAWRPVMVLRAYAHYLRQTGTTFSERYIEQVLVGNPRIARLLVRLFESRFDPRVTVPTDAHEELGSAITEEIEGALDAVTSLDEDRILRSFLAMIRATLRTNYYQRTANGIAQAVPVAEVRPRGDPGPAAAPAEVRDLRVLAAAGGRAPAVRVRSRAAACAGRTAVRTSVPRSSAWSRRRR